MNGVDRVVLLKQIASQHRTRVVSVKLYDANVGVSGVDWRDALENRPPKPDWFRHQLQVTLAGRRVTLSSNDRFVAVRVRCNFGNVTPFSVNRRDRVFFSGDQPVGRVGTRQWPVFSAAGTDLRSILGLTHVESAIEAFDLSDDESVHVYGNGVSAYVQPKSVQQLLDVISRMVVLVGQLPTAKDQVTDLRRPLTNSWLPYRRSSTRLQPAAANAIMTGRG